MEWQDVQRAYEYIAASQEGDKRGQEVHHEQTGVFICPGPGAGLPAPGGAGADSDLLRGTHRRQVGGRPGRGRGHPEPGESQGRGPSPAGRGTAPAAQPGPAGVGHRAAGAGLPPVGQPAAHGGGDGALRVSLPVPPRLCAGGAGFEPFGRRGAGGGGYALPHRRYRAGCRAVPVGPGDWNAGPGGAVRPGILYTGKATAKAGKAFWRWLQRSVGKGRRRAA